METPLREQLVLALVATPRKVVVAAREANVHEIWPSSVAWRASDAEKISCADTIVHSLVSEACEGHTTDVSVWFGRGN